METKIKQNLKKGIATYTTIANFLIEEKREGKNLTNAKINDLFKMVPKEDYKKSEQDELLAYLYSLVSVKKSSKKAL